MGLNLQVFLINFVITFTSFEAFEIKPSLSTSPVTNGVSHFIIGDFTFFDLLYKYSEVFTQFVYEPIHDYVAVMLSHRRDVSAPTVSPVTSMLSDHFHFKREATLAGTNC